MTRARHAKSTPAATTSHARYYSLRRLSPYQGTVQVVELPGFRAMSADGITWTVQMPNEGSRFATHALWRADGSGTLVEDERTHVSIEALRAHPPFRFRSPTGWSCGCSTTKNHCRSRFSPAPCRARHRRA